MQHRRSDTYGSWLAGELVLLSLLALATLLLWATDRLDGYAQPDVRLALDTCVGVLACIVAILAATRFRVEGRWMDLVLSLGFAMAAISWLGFSVAPNLGVQPLGAAEAWAGLGCRIIASALIAVAPFLTGRIRRRQAALGAGLAAVTVGVFATWGLARAASPGLPRGGADPMHVAAYAVLAVLALVAAVGYGLRYRRYGRDLDSWLALALTLILFSELQYVLMSGLSGRFVLQGDFLRLVAYGVLLVGVWRAIGQAEFGRAVAEERARVAREIHDGLAQYLFAISTSVSMLEAGASLDGLLPRLKEASNAAQQEARFAVLALSSASGTAPFDAALRRYVEFLVSDGLLDVELDIDSAVALAPDEQIEIFRIVQEGLANARRHAGARRVWVDLHQRGNRRVLCVRDDGEGFDGDVTPAGQGLRNMRRRADSIDGGFTLDAAPGRGTSIEVVLRAA